ncbi:MAG: ferrochelatase [Xanthomonadales bacterium]|nr:ferrochelatase [Xanthomonadales bacterium]
MPKSAQIDQIPNKSGKNHPASSAVVLVNLGTPAQLGKKSVRKFLAEFLSDPRVVSLPRWLWLTILYLLILPFRSSKTLEMYRQVWMPEGSPLRVFSSRLVAKVDGQLPQHKVKLAMRYGEPSVSSVLEEFARDGIDDITVMPLYPQYSTTTSASVFDAVDNFYNTRQQPSRLNLIEKYYHQSSWQQAIADSITDWQAQQGQPELLVFSFHGLPQLLDRRGDPYRQQCEASVAGIVKHLGISADQYLLCYQSRFGRAAWLQPYLEPELQRLAAEGVRRLQVVCPCFAVDGIETLEEIAIRAKRVFLEAGGESLQYIPALNDSDRHATVLSEIVEKGGVQLG